MKHILFIATEFPPSPGGIGNQAFNLCQTLVKEGYYLEVLAQQDLVNEVERNQFNKKISDFKIKSYPRYRYNFLTYSNRFLATYTKLNANNFDVCICSGKFALWQGGLFSKLFPGIAFLAIAHGSEINLKQFLPKKITEWALKQFDKIVSISDFTANLLPYQPNKQIRTIIPNGINVNELANAKGYGSEEIEKLEGNPALLTVGNVTLRKGQQRVIKSLPNILKYFPGAHYHVVGLPTMKAEFEQLANELNVLNHVTFHHNLNRKQLLKAYQGCDLFIMLSENQLNGDVEGFGIAILEANFFGKPAIGAKHCGIENAINEEQNGYLVDGDQPEEIAKAVYAAFQNQVFMISKAINWAENHSWKKLGKHYKAAIES